MAVSHQDADYILKSKLRPNTSSKEVMVGCKAYRRSTEQVITGKRMNKKSIMKHDM